MKKHYIARDENGELWLYDEKPVIKNNIKIFEGIWMLKDLNYLYHSIKLDSNLFPEVTFESGVKEIELNIIN